MLNKLRNVFNDSADLLVGGGAGVAVYSAFSHAATEREMVSAVCSAIVMAAIVVSQVWTNKLSREADEIRRSKPAP